MTTRFDVSTMEKCQAFATLVRQHVQLPMTIGLIGTLGAGKTQFTRFLAMACGTDPESISSPTFTLVHHYPGNPDLFHLDVFRVKTDDEFYELGVDELFVEPAIVAVEWADRFPNCLPEDRLQLTFQLDGECRSVIAIGLGPRSQQMVEQMTVAWQKCHN